MNPSRKSIHNELSKFLLKFLQESYFSILAIYFFNTHSNKLYIFFPSISFNFFFYYSLLVWYKDRHVGGRNKKLKRNYLAKLALQYLVEGMVSLLETHTESHTHTHTQRKRIWLTKIWKNDIFFFSSALIDILTKTLEE